MIIRKYLSSDCKYLAELFYQTVHSINTKDYTEEQLNAWATGNVDIEKWNLSLSEHFTLVATKSNMIVGFGDIDKTGYLDNFLTLHERTENPTYRFDNFSKILYQPVSVFHVLNNIHDP